MPDARTMHSPYPSGQGAASVPVLFSLPNVQPAIAAANVTPEGTARNTSPTAELQASGSLPSSALTAHAGAAFESVSQAKTDTYSKKSPGTGSKLGHITNAVIGVLLLAVVSLTIRNFAPTKPGAANNQSPGDSNAKLTNSPTASHGTPTANTTSSGTHPGTAAVLVASKIDNIQQSDTASRGGGRTDAPAAAVTSVPEENLEFSASQGSPEESLKEHEESHEENLAGSTTSVPSVPLLLPSKEPKTALGGGATLQYPQPASDASAVAPGPYGTTAVNSTAVNSTTATSTAVNSTTATSAAVNSTAVNSTAVDASADAMPSQVKGNVSLISSPNRYSGNSSVGIPNTVDTGTPSLNTRDMINLRNGQRSAKGIVGGTTTVRNPMARGQEAMNPTQSMLMSGETYPPIRKQYEPINIPSAGTPGSSTYQPIYQPALQPNATPQPYTPLTPTFPTPDGTALAPTTPNR